MRIYHIDDLGLRKSPKNIIEGEKEKRVEQAYIKLPGKNLINVSLEGSNKIGAVSFDREKIKSFLRKYGKSKYSNLHTHFKHDSYALPSSKDLKNFLSDDGVRTMFIAQVNKYTGKVNGYFCLRKTKKTKPYESPRKSIFDEKLKEKKIKESAEIYESQVRNRELEQALKKLEKDYHLNFRIVPAKDYGLDAKKLDSSLRFVKRGKLEKIVTLMISLTFLVSMFFLSPNVTSNVVGDLTKNTSNLIGGILFIFCLIGVFVQRLLK